MSNPRIITLTETRMTTLADELEQGAIEPTEAARRLRAWVKQLNQHDARETKVKQSVRRKAGK